jgi:membrane-associated protease RseP (regulator of RpoE activity)
MEVGIKDEVLTVIAPLKDTPAYRGGIKAGDKIVKIDGKSTQGLTVEKAVDKIRGKGGSIRHCKHLAVTGDADGIACTHTTSDVSDAFKRVNSCGKQKQRQQRKRDRPR